jgi:hypothetical protein
MWETSQADTTALQSAMDKHYLVNTRECDDSLELTFSDGTVHFCTPIDLIELAAVGKHPVPLPRISYH